MKGTVEQDDLPAQLSICGFLLCGVPTLYWGQCFTALRYVVILCCGALWKLGRSCGTVWSWDDERVPQRWGSGSKTRDVAGSWKSLICVHLPIRKGAANETHKLSPRFLGPNEGQG